MLVAALLLLTNHAFGFGGDRYRFPLRNVAWRAAIILEVEVACYRDSAGPVDERLTGQVWKGTLPEGFDMRDTHVTSFEGSEASFEGFSWPDSSFQAGDRMVLLLDVAGNENWQMDENEGFSNIRNTRFYLRAHEVAAFRAYLETWLALVAAKDQRAQLDHLVQSLSSPLRAIREDAALTCNFLIHNGVAIPPYSLRFSDAGVNEMIMDSVVPGLTEIGAQHSYFFPVFDLDLANISPKSRRAFFQLAPACLSDSFGGILKVAVALEMPGVSRLLLREIEARIEQGAARLPGIDSLSDGEERVLTEPYLHFPVNLCFSVLHIPYSTPAEKQQAVRAWVALMQLDATWCLPGHEGRFHRRFLVEMLDKHIPNPENRTELLEVCINFPYSQESEAILRQHLLVLLAVYAQELAN